jgi:hypothetical protein
MCRQRYKHRTSILLKVEQNRTYGLAENRICKLFLILLYPLIFSVIKDIAKIPLFLEKSDFYIMLIGNLA